MGSRVARWVLVTCMILTALAGCGQDQSADEPLPGLVQELDRIDDAIAAGRYSRARTALDALVETTGEARLAGDLGTAQADDITVAAARLRAALPAVRPTSATPGATGPTQETTASPAPREDDEEHGKGRAEKHGKGHRGD